ncbi:hypothetical protein WMY93_032642 [Mugilogobius chulae]|uniref:F-box domain-containing protein n=1 Tax=Mugilogobius chulae TaxID=88201 RepID=A0AAW0MNJ2_9GOBI
MADVSSVPRLQDLPSDPLLHVLSYLSFRDLLRSDRADSALSWYGLFVHTYSDLGRYVEFYASLKQHWDQLKDFLQQRCPRIIAFFEGKTPKPSCENTTAPNNLAITTTAPNNPAITTQLPKSLQ